MPESTIIVCPHCGAKNRIPTAKTGSSAKCGRCHNALPAVQATAGAETVLNLRCSQCRAKNRVPILKLHAGAKCGRCGNPLPHQNILNGQPVMVTDANFAQTVLQSPLPVLLYGWAPWCSVCSSTGPMVDRLAIETKGKIRIGKLNTEKNPKLASQFNILSVPSFFIFDAGKLKEHLPGAVPKHELLIKMARYI